MKLRIADVEPDLKHIGHAHAVETTDLKLRRSALAAWCPLPRQECGAGVVLTQLSKMAWGRGRDGLGVVLAGVVPLRRWGTISLVPTIDNSKSDTRMEIAWDVSSCRIYNLS
jgi:hypothetical protein